MGDSPENAANSVEFNLNVRFYTDDVNYLFVGGHRNRDTAYIPRYSVVVRHLHGIYSEMLSDNPFAENILIELDVRLGQLAQLAETRIETCQASAGDAEEEEGIVIRPFTRRQPYLYRNVMTYDEYGRYLLRTYGRTDRCIRWIRTLNGASRIPSRRAEDWIRELLKRHRGLNEVIIYYAKRMRRVTRSEVREGNQKAVDMARALGRQVAPDVLAGTRRCQYYRVGRLGASGIDRRPPQDEKPEAVRSRRAAKKRRYGHLKALRIDDIPHQSDSARHCGRAGVRSDARRRRAETQARRAFSRHESENSGGTAGGRPVEAPFWRRDQSPNDVKRRWTLWTL